MHMRNHSQVFSTKGITANARLAVNAGKRLWVIAADERLIRIGYIFFKMHQNKTERYSYKLFILHTERVSVVLLKLPEWITKRDAY